MVPVYLRYTNGWGGDGETEKSILLIRYSEKKKKKKDILTKITAKVGIL